EVSRAIAAAARASGVLAAGKSFSTVVAPLSEAPAEPFDPDRFDYLMEEYSIPSYDAGGKKKVQTKPARPAQHPGLLHFWKPMKEGDFHDSLRKVIADVVRQWGPLPAGAPRGVILQRKVGNSFDWLVVIFSTPLTVFTFANFGHYEYVGEKANPP